ncbi:MAG: hypothetical protein U0638_09655 [Phycisphaerales bacterium]
MTRESVTYVAIRLGWIFTLLGVVWAIASWLQPVGRSHPTVASMMQGRDIGSVAEGLGYLVLFASGGLVGAALGLIALRASRGKEGRWLVVVALLAFAASAMNELRPQAPEARATVQQGK